MPTSRKNCAVSVGPNLYATAVNSPFLGYSVNKAIIQSLCILSTKISNNCSCLIVYTKLQNTLIEQSLLNIGKVYINFFNLATPKLSLGIDVGSEIDRLHT